MYMQPLAERMRPKTFEEMVGQSDLLAANGVLFSSIKAKKPLSLLLWGGPGCGKTTLARLYAKAFDLPFHPISAATSSAVELRDLIHQMQATPLTARGSIIFIDEIHRYNKAQQDLLLPHVERGFFTLIAATTENPSFALNNALLSRLRVLTLNPLKEEELERLLHRYECQEKPLPLTEEARNHLLLYAQGDARHLFNMVEDITLHLVQMQGEPFIDADSLKLLVQRRLPLSDRGGQWHHNLISALHKAVRGSDPDGALYWLCRLLEAGIEPRYLARRLIRMATEDVGLADPYALQLAVAASQSYEQLGSPEGELALAEVCVYLALAPRSNAIYVAYQKAREAAGKTSHLLPPKHILNAPTSFMKQQGYGKGYVYDHDTEEGFSGQDYLPEGVEKGSYYAPTERGFEAQLKKRIASFAVLRKKNR